MKRCAILLRFWFSLLICGAAALPAEDSASHSDDVTFVAKCDGTEQKYVLVYPRAFSKESPVDVLIALHGCSQSCSSV